MARATHDIGTNSVCRDIDCYFYELLMFFFNSIAYKQKYFFTCNKSLLKRVNWYSQSSSILDDVFCFM